MIQRIPKLFFLFSAAGLLWSVSFGQAAVIQPVASNGMPLPSAQVTLSLLQNGNDVSDTWLPEPGVPVEIAVNGVASPDIQLIFDPATAANPVLNQALTTSAYPGQCTNTDNPPGADPTNAQNTDKFMPDFRLNINVLTPTDCGGMAVLTINDSIFFVIPRDSDFDGMADHLEQMYCPSGDVTCLVPNSDIEKQGSNPQEGDAFSNFDELRGFKINGSVQRFDPTMKDLLVHLLNPQCTRLASIPPGSPNDEGTESLIGEPGIVFPTDDTNANIFGNIASLGGDPNSSASAHIHFIGFEARNSNGPTTEWVDTLIRFDPQNTPNFDFGTDPNAPLFDRQVNRNAVYPLGRSIQDTAGQTHIVHKGIRIIECLDDLVSSPIGFAVFPPGIFQGTPDEDTNSIIYTQRIFDDYENLLNHAGNRGKPSVFKDCALSAASPCAFLSTYNPSSNKWTIESSPRTRNDVISRYIPYVLNMELGHSINLIPEIQITEYGSHFAPGTGSFLDQRVIAKDSNKQGGVIFQIPNVFDDKSNAGFHLH